jgi:Icc-related predicted phosphoesterase
VPNKIYVAGNHDTSIAVGLVKPRFFENNGIIYLQDQEVVIDGVKFYGSPWTPSFGNWGFMKKRHKLHDIWTQIPEDTDVLITHGPPKGVRDLTLNRDNELEQVGDISLVKRIVNLKLKLHCFGHIHDTDGIRNQGTSKYSGIPTIFSNAACVTDGKNEITSFGNRINLLQ